MADRTRMWIAIRISIREQTAERRGLEWGGYSRQWRLAAAGEPCRQNDAKTEPSGTKLSALFTPLPLPPSHTHTQSILLYLGRDYI